MIKAAIKYGKKTLATRFPITNDELSDHLCSIGITTNASEIPVFGTDSIEVQLANNDDIGFEIINRLSEDDTISGLNTACEAVAKCEPYGYSVFLDMLNPKSNSAYDFYKPYETIEPSRLDGVKGILEEVTRYSSTMENYRKACESKKHENNKGSEE